MALELKSWQKHFLKTNRSVSIKHKLPPKKPIEYFHYICKEDGDRYFQVDWTNNTCIQIIVEPGRLKKGRQNMIGVNRMAMSTFRTKYYWYFGRLGLSGSTKMLMTTENQFDQAYNKVLTQIVNIQQQEKVSQNV